MRIFLSLSERQFFFESSAGVDRISVKNERDRISVKNERDRISVKNERKE